MASFWASAAAGAGLEIVFGSFLKLVIDVMKKNTMFGPTLKLLADTLRSLEPKVKQFEAYNKEFDRPEGTKRLRDLLTEGEALVLACSKIRTFDLVRRPRYTQKLLDLDKSIGRSINFDLQLQQSEGINEINFEVRQTGAQVRELKNEFRKIADANGGLFGERILRGECSPPGLKVDPVGLETPLRDLKRMLLNEEDPFLVLSAPGGCGKTTLAIAICQEADIKEKFKDNIFFIYVPKPPNLRIIVQKLFHHFGYEMPECQREDEAANHLERLLIRMSTSVPILLVLDDVWSESESILRNVKFRMQNYRILVTSRFEFPQFGSTYRLKALNDTDAMALFCQSASVLEGNWPIPDEDVNKMIRSCKGLPLAISVTGSLLRGRPAAEWRKRVKDWSSAAAIVSNSEILNCLQRSLDVLNDNTVLKECFMDLGAFPEDHRIAACTLIDMWVGLHQLDEDDAIVNLYELSKCNLLDLVVKRKDASEDDGFYNNHSALQHDLLRELALLQSNSGSIEHRKRIFLEIKGNRTPEWWLEQKNLFINANLLSICTDDMFSSSWCNVQATQLKVLLLNFQTKNYTLPDFINGVEKLEVLIIINTGPFHAVLCNFSLFGSLSNLKRIRLEKVSIPSFFLPNIQLMKLQKISLVNCNVHQGFSNLAAPISDALPNLEEINIDYCYDMEALPAGLCSLVLLKKLSITNCHKLSALPEDLGKLVELEVLRLSSCFNLLKLPDTIGSLEKLSILDLSDCFSLTKLPEGIGGLHNLRKLNMMGCPRNCQLPQSVLNLQRPLEVVCNEETASSWEPFSHLCSNLRIKVKKEDPILYWPYN